MRDLLPYPKGLVRTPRGPCYDITGALLGAPEGLVIRGLVTLS